MRAKKVIPKRSRGPHKRKTAPMSVSVVVGKRVLRIGGRGWDTLTSRQFERVILPVK